MERFKEFMKKIEEHFFETVNLTLIFFTATIFLCLIYSILPTGWQEAIKSSAEKMLSYLALISNQDTLRVMWRIMLTVVAGLFIFSILRRLLLDLTKEIMERLKNGHKKGIHSVVATSEIIFSGWVAYILATSQIVKSATDKIAQLMVR